MRRLFAGLALALLIASPVAGKAGASITAPPDGLTFGDSFSVAYVEPNHWTGYLYAYGACFQDGERVWGQYEELPASSLFVLGPTPSWAGGAADCIVELVVFSEVGKRSVYAEDAFSVGG